VGYSERVVAGFASDKKSVIIGHVNHTIPSRPEKTSQFVTSFLGQLMQQVVAEPVVASRVAESDFKLRPRTIEKVGSMDILLDQQRNAVGYTTYSHSVNKPSAV